MQNSTVVAAPPASAKRSKRKGRGRSRPPGEQPKHSKFTVRAARPLTSVHAPSSAAADGPTNKQNAGNTPGMKKKNNKRKNRGKSRNAMTTYAGDKENAANRKQEEADASVGKRSVALPTVSPEPVNPPSQTLAAKAGSWLETLGLTTLAPAVTGATINRGTQAEDDLVGGDSAKGEESESGQQDEEMPTEEGDTEPPQFCYSSTVASVFNGNVVVLDMSTTAPVETMTFRPAKASLRSRRHWTGSRPTVTRLMLNPAFTDYGDEIVVVPDAPAALEVADEEEEFCEAGQFDCGLFFLRLFRINP